MLGGRGEASVRESPSTSQAARIAAPSERPWRRSDPGANSRAALAAAPRVESSQAVGAIPNASAMAAMRPFMEGLLAETPNQTRPNPSDDGDGLENGGH